MSLVGENNVAHPAPAERARQIVAGAERQHADGGPRADAVQHAQHPAHGAVPAARQHAQVRHLTEKLQPMEHVSGLVHRC